MTDLVVVDAGGRTILFEEDFGPSPGVGRKGQTNDVAIRGWLKDTLRGGEDGEPRAKLADISGTILTVRDAVVKALSGVATEQSGGGTFKTAEVSFGIKVSAEGNTFVAKVGAEANLNVKFVWEF
jgi:hypothetical protein